MKIELDPHGPGGADKPYCLVNTDGSVAECFATHAEAVAAMGKSTRANRYSYSEPDNFSLAPVQGVEFADGGVWIEALQAKDYHTAKYGKVPVTKDKLNNLATSVKNNVRGIQLSTDYDHGSDPAKGKKASGTIRDAKVENDTLLLNVEFTPTAQKEIQDGEWKYFSSDWLDNYVHDDGKEYTDVLLGGGLTNRPVAKGLNPLPVNFSELFEITESTQFAVLTAAQRDALPASKFLYVEPDGTKHLPVPDQTHIRNAISRLSQPDTGEVAGESWLTPALRKRLLSKARAMLNKKMSEENMNELLKRLAESLNITFSEDTDDETLAKQIETRFAEMNEELKPLRELKTTVDSQKSFAEQFPEQAAQMEADKQFRIEANSKAFADTIGSKRFSESLGKEDKEGNPVIVVTNKGLSGKALEAIRQTHLKFAEGSVTADDFTNTINAIMEDGIVEYGERGTSVGDGVASKGGDEPLASASVAANRNAFAEKVREYIKENSTAEKAITFAEAYPIVAQEYPKMYDAYLGERVEV